MILLFSGGIDSYVAWHYLDKPYTVYFDLGTPYSEKEKIIVQELIPTTIINDSLKLGDQQQEENAYIPFRNLHLALLAYQYAPEIIICGIKDDIVSDKNPQIFAEFSKIMSVMEKKTINVYSPFFQYTKTQIIDWYINNGGNIDHLWYETISCYNAEMDSVYCGDCGSCFRKWNAFWEHGYHKTFHNMDIMNGYLERAIKGHYHNDRNESIVRCIQDYKRIFIGGM